jgi:hypothetical protein
MLDLRRRQLTAARCQILDHVADPAKCPLEQRAERLPAYPDEVSIFGLSGSHSAVPRLLEAAETYSANEHVNDLVRGRLSRARRTTHPPVLSATRYQPPQYDELADPDLVRRRYARLVPPSVGQTPEYCEEPDYGGNIRTTADAVEPVVQELGSLVSRAREHLSISEPQRESQETIMREVLRSLAGLGIPVFFSR